VTAAAQQHVKARVVEHAGARVGVVTLSRAEKKNALTPAMLAGLLSAIEGFAVASDVGAVMIEGEGAAFCAGFDLSLCKENSEALKELLTGLSGVIRAMRACPVPVVVAAHGAAIAGGCAMLAGADVVVTHNDCKLGYPVVRLGISPAVNAPALRLAIGDGATRERLLNSQLISGWDALRLGLAHECIEDAGKVRDRAKTIAQQLAAKPGPGMRATKALLNEIDGSMDDAARLRGLNASLGLVGSAEERARLAEIWKSG
jgi:methylglutaconyl-CoA hydratase